MTWNPRLLRQLWTRLRSTYWFLPAAIISGCVGLAYGMLELDAVLPQRAILQLGWVYTRDPAGARALLSVISESMITVAGVVFSVVVVALTLASNQFGTRVLKSFARDSGNQIVLGTFLGTFLYGVLVMRRVESEHHQFVPSLAVAVCIFLAMASVAVLVYFIHHVIMEIQAENVVAAVARDLFGTIDSVFPESLGHGAYTLQPESHPHIELPDAHRVCSDIDGFIRTIDSDRALDLAIRHDSMIEVVPLPGTFVTLHSVLARFSGTKNNEHVAKALLSCFDIGKQRTYEQDLSFAFDQLSLIAVRSMSPAINAAGAAEDAVTWLKSGLIRLGDRKIPSGYRYDNNNRLRVVTPTWELQRLLDHVLGPIRDVAHSHPDFVLHTILALGDVAHITHNPVLIRALQDHIQRFADIADEFPQEADKRSIRNAARGLLRQARSA